MRKFFINLWLLVFPCMSYCQLTLKDVARLSRTSYLHHSGLDGTGMTVYIIEPFPPFSENKQFENRLKSTGTFPISSGIGSLHATHVAGIILCGGIGGYESMKGIAYKANGITNNHLKNTNLYSPDVLRLLLSEGNLIEDPRPIYLEIENLSGYIAGLLGPVISNHSYGVRLLEDNRPGYFGSYSCLSRKYDSTMYELGHWLPVVSSGNDGAIENPKAHTKGKKFDLIETDLATAKNSLTVANVGEADILPNGDFLSASLHSTSSSGPTDDYRIKPEIAAPGTQILSCGEEKEVTEHGVTRTEYFAEGTGTSMAAPVVAGTAVLLQQLFHKLYKRYMQAATLKGLLLHTADLMHTTPGQVGPDARSGYGLINGKFADETISGRYVSSIVEELSLKEGESYSLKVTAEGFTPLQVSISWTDPQQTIDMDGVVNSTTKTLVNDLDLMVKRKDGTSFFPYLLTSASTTTTGVNKADPYERVDINSLLGKEYEIIVTSNRTLKNGSQKFSLIITGLGNADKCLLTARINVPVTDPANIAVKDIYFDGQANGTRGPIRLQASHEAVFLSGTEIRNVEDLHCLIAHSDCKTDDEAPGASSRKSSQQEEKKMSTDDNASVKSGLQIYPNPAKESVTILCKECKIRKVQLFNADGHLLLSNNYNRMQSARLDISRFSANVYFISVTKEDGTLVRAKLIKY